MGMCYWSITRWAKSLTARFVWTSQWGHVTILNSLLRTGRMCMYPLNWYGSLERRYLGRCVNVSICSCDPFPNIWWLTPLFCWTANTVQTRSACVTMSVANLKRKMPNAALSALDQEASIIPLPPAIMKPQPLWTGKQVRFYSMWILQWILVCYLQSTI